MIPTLEFDTYNDLINYIEEEKATISDFNYTQKKHQDILGNNLYSISGVIKINNDSFSIKMDEYITLDEVNLIQNYTI